MCACVALVVSRPCEQMIASQITKEISLLNFMLVVSSFIYILSFHCPHCLHTHTLRCFIKVTIDKHSHQVNLEDFVSEWTLFTVRMV